jgi:hypothetical protein
MKSRDENRGSFFAQEKDWPQSVQKRTQPPKNTK